MVLAVDVTPWVRPDANTSPKPVVLPHLWTGMGSAEMIPGWPYSMWPRWSRPHLVDGAAGCAPADARCGCRGGDRRAGT
jgi:hypothetical protein